jgi:hypothetical protein
VGVDKGIAAGDTACEVDTDCVHAFWGVSCYYQCGSSFLSLTGQSEARTQIEADTAPICAELDGRCERQPASSCPPVALGIPQCNAGTCQELDLAPLSCGELSTEASDRQGELLDRADRSCNVDADCTVVTRGVSCAFGCNEPISLAVTGVTALSEGLERVERDLCQTFSGRFCPPPPIPSCDPPAGNATASCNAGQCELSE